MKFKKVLIRMLIFVVIICVGIIFWYCSGNKAVNNEKDKEIIKVEISEGMREFGNCEFARK